jgi:hypothetical protein
MHLGVADEPSANLVIPDLPAPAIIRKDDITDQGYNRILAFYRIRIWLPEQKA